MKGAELSNVEYLANLTLGSVALHFRFRGLCGFGRRVLHAFFQGADALAKPFAKLGKFLGAKHQQGNKKDHQKVHWLKKTFKHKYLPAESNYCL